jgi:hypothetical protein
MKRKKQIMTGEKNSLITLQSYSGLPDGLFFIPKIPIGVNFEGLGMEKVGIFFGRLKYITDVGYTSWPFGN